MDLEGVIPVSVPVEPGRSTEITIPHDTHIMYWCSILPFAYPLFYRDDIDGKHGLESLRNDLEERDLYLKNSVDIRFKVSGEEVHLMKTSEQTYLYGNCYWIITEPLPTGTHSIELTLEYDSEEKIPHGVNGAQCPPSSPPPLYSLPDETIIEWDTDSKLVTNSTISVIEVEKDDLETKKDPFWDRKDVYTAIERTEQTS